MHGDVLVAVVTLLLVLATVASIVAAWRLGKRQEELQKNLADLARSHDNDLAKQRHEQTERERLFQQRSQLVPMWRYISTLSDIDPTEAVTPDVIKAVNTLEFIAVCCEAEVVDRTVVMRTFRKKYIDLYDKIEKCGPLPGLNGKTGKELLAENRAATLMYRKLEKERSEEDQPPTLTGATVDQRNTS